MADSDLRNDENIPGLTSSAATEECQDVSSKNTIDEMADAITAGSDIGLVEFVLAPQHETSCDPETTAKEDFDYY